MSSNNSSGRDATHETLICNHLRTRISELEDSHQINGPRINSKRLEFMLGLGDRPRIRRALYRKICRLAKKHGPRIDRLVMSVAYRAMDKQEPGRFFASVIIDELGSLGILDGDT